MPIFNKILIAALLLSLSACGYSAKDGEAIGQAKRVTQVTPLICFNYEAFDLSLGIMVKGVGSMSTHDMFFTVYDPILVNKLKDAVNKGSIVRIKYDTRRIPICTEKHILTGIEDADIK